MKKLITVIHIIFISMAVAGILLGMWQRGLLRDDENKGLSRPLEMCIYDQMQNFLGDIVGMWAGISLLLKPSYLRFLYPNKDSLAYHLSMMSAVSPEFATRVWALLILLVSMYSFWHVWIPSLSTCPS